MKGLGVALAAVGIEVAEAALVVLVAASKGHRRVAWRQPHWPRCW